ncbi:MAG: LicD family protein [Bacteroidaceae bacterium]|nr:LicD family protein [Bacteroidaceae bacterium]
MIEKAMQQELRSLYNPDGSRLRTIQLNLLDILIEFDRICRNNEIPYWLDSGTLIGAARHGGFIPWDDDLDVCILRKDRNRLVKAMREELPSPFTCETDLRCWLKIFNRQITVSREVPAPGKSGNTVIRKENIWMDVFIETNGNARLSRMITGFYGRCFRRRYRIVEDGTLKYLAGVCLYPFASLMASAARFWGRVFHPQTFIHDFGTGFYSERKKDDIFPLQEIEFEGHLFPAPCRTAHYLARIYGDWNSLPQNIENHNITEIYDKQQ